MEWTNKLDQQANQGRDRGNIEYVCTQIREFRLDMVHRPGGADYVRSEKKRSRRMGKEEMGERTRDKKLSRECFRMLPA